MLPIDLESLKEKKRTRIESMRKELSEFNPKSECEKNIKNLHLKLMEGFI